MRRWVEAFILLVFITLAWYGAEMLLYGYSQVSVVKSLVVIWISADISGRTEKERIINERKEEFRSKLIDAVAQGIRDARDTANGNSEKAE